MYYAITRTDELQHHGIKGMKWGVRRYQNADGTYTDAGRKRRGYSSKSLSAVIAKRQNKKVDKSFNNWKENSKKKETAIELGKKANEARRNYESDKSNKDLKANYKDLNSAYKKALRSNTTYRKGQIKGEVGSDLSRKYLSAAKKVEKQLRNDPNNKALKKEYDSLMSKHDIERAKARKAPAKYANRSNKKASIKRKATMTAKGIAGTAAVAAGVYAVNRYLDGHDVTLNGAPINFNVANVKNTVNQGKKVISAILKYV